MSSPLPLLDPGNPPDPARWTRAFPLFSTLTPGSAAALAALMEPVSLAPGEAVFARGIESDALCLLVEGEVRATEPGDDGAEVPVRVLRPGEAFDEMQLLAGIQRPLELRAAGEVRLARLRGGDADALAARLPDFREARERMHRRQLLCRLHPAFGAFDARLLDDVEESADWVHPRRGELLFEQDTGSEGLYFVVSGRMRILQYERDGSVRALGEVGMGESVGEMALFGGRRREERVQAARDSVLVGFTSEEFDALVARQPQLLRRVARTLVERLHRGAQGCAARVANVAVVPVTGGVAAGEFCGRLAAALAPFGAVLRLTAAEVEARMAEPGISRAWDDSADSARLLAWLEAQEAAHRFVLYEVEEGATPWTRRCLRQADRVLLVADAAEGPRVGELERALATLEGRVADVHQALVLLHPDGERLPSGTSGWLAERPWVREHHHLRLDRDGDFARLGRVLAGRTVGVVLGGGGARGLAHIGALRALEEAGVPVDAIGGTSMGASIAAQYALGWSTERMVETNRRVFLEMKPHRGFTVPILSLVGTQRPELSGRWVYGDAEIEDLWIPFFCISSDLTTAEMVVHRTGLLRRAALASSSLPAFAVPVLHGNHLLVDGALLNNVPTDVMRESGCGTVIAAEVSVEEDETFTCERVPTAWEVVRNRFSRGRPAVRFPSLMEVIMRATLLHSTYRQRVALQEADLCLRPPIDRFGLMDFHRIDEIVRVGYEDARERVRAWREEEGRAESVPA